MCSDITKCAGTGCPWKERCSRFTSIPSKVWQSWFAAIPGHPDDDLGWVCDEYQGDTKSCD